MQRPVRRRQRRFVKDSINRMTWWGLGTKAGGEVISSDAY